MRSTVVIRHDGLWLWRMIRHVGIIDIDTTRKLMPETTERNFGKQMFQRVHSWILGPLFAEANKMKIALLKYPKRAAMQAGVDLRSQSRSFPPNCSVHSCWCRLTLRFTQCVHSGLPVRRSSRRSPRGRSRPVVMDRCETLSLSLFLLRVKHL